MAKYAFLSPDARQQVFVGVSHCAILDQHLFAVEIHLAVHLDQVSIAILTLDAEPGLCLPVAAVWHQRLKREAMGGILRAKNQNTEGF